MTRRHTFVPLLLLPLMMPVALAQAEDCAATLAVVRQLYHNTTMECAGGDPGSDCSGIWLRGTTRPERNDPPGKAGDFRVWEPSPTAQKLGTTAASYMREDINYASPGVRTKDGYILYPVDLTPAGEPKSHIACMAALDAWTDFRSDCGCGDDSNTKKTERSCQEEGVNGSNWKATQFDPFPTNSATQGRLRNESQCMFNMRGDGRTQAFKDFVTARRSIEGSDTAFQTQTEFRFYHPKKPEVQPVLAFFCNAKHKPDSCNDALKNQAEYLSDTGKHRPVIEISFPARPGGKATFACNAASDNAVSAGGYGPGGSRQCSQYIKSVTWIKRYDPGFKRDMMTAQVVPTDCGRQIGEDQTDKMYAELERKAKAQPDGEKHWGNSKSMRRQLVCHLTLVDGKNVVRNKAEFNLEPERSDVSHEESLKQKCNNPW